MNFIGMDTSQVSTAAEQMRGGARRIEVIASGTSSSTRALVPASWRGADAELFLSRIGTLESSLQSLRNAILERGSELDRQVADQNEASAGSHTFTLPASRPIQQAGAPIPQIVPSALPGGTPSLPDFDPKTAQNLFGGSFKDKSFSDYWENLKDLLPISPLDGASGTIGPPHSFAKWAEKILFDNKVPRFIPIVGDVATGVFAGIDRWKADEGKGYSTGDRIGRAVLDGGMNLLGSLLGSAAGGGPGAAIGGFFGGLAGGTGGGAAGAAAGGAPAAPGAAAGGVGGAAIGGIIGGVVGDTVGSYIGATLFDAAIDTYLD